MILAGLQFSYSVGVGTFLTVAVMVAGVVTLFWKIRQGDPSEWRENYLGEVTRREEVERERDEQRELKHQALTELAASKARTDLVPVMQALTELASVTQRSEERMTARLDAFEENQRQTAEILSGLVAALRPPRHVEGETSWLPPSPSTT